MRHLRGLVLSTLSLLGIARRALSGDSLDNTQQQTNTLTKALGVSEGSQDSLLPAFRRPPKFLHAARLGIYRATPPLRMGPRPTDAILAASGPEQDQLLPKDDETSSDQANRRDEVVTGRTKWTARTAQLYSKIAVGQLTLIDERKNAKSREKRGAETNGLVAETNRLVAETNRRVAETKAARLRTGNWEEDALVGPLKKLRNALVGPLPIRWGITEAWEEDSMGVEQPKGKIPVVEPLPKKLPKAGPPRGKTKDSGFTGSSLTAGPRQEMFEPDAIKATPELPATRAAPAFSTLQAPSPRAIRFRELLAAVTLTDERLAMLDDAGLRTLLTGIQGAAEQPLVLDAFTVLYEDLAPVRLAGDLIFRSVAKRVRAADAAATKLAAELAANIETARQPSEADIVLARKLFDLVDRDSSGTLSRAELLESGLLRSCRLGNCSVEDVNRFMREVDVDNSGHVNFIEFMILAPRVLFEDDGSSSFAENAPQVIAALEASRDGGVADAVNDERFEAMLRAVLSWDLDATDDSRFGIVVRGAQAGGGEARVVSALQHLYINYAPMRIAGNLIFKLMNAYLGRS